MNDAHHSRTAQQIKAYSDANDRSLAWIAAQAGVSRQYVAQVVNGERSASEALVMSLRELDAEAFAAGDAQPIREAPRVALSDRVASLEERTARLELENGGGIWRAIRAARRGETWGDGLDEDAVAFVEDLTETWGRG